MKNIHENDVADNKKYLLSEEVNSSLIAPVKSMFTYLCEKKKVGSIRPFQINS